VDKHVRNQSEGGLVKITGATTPTGFPHLCPYQPNGATVEVCKEFTSNYQRNLAGCCGTQDNRAFAPCNSQFRKRHKCLSEGKGSKAGLVVDIKRGLCEDCAQSAGKPPKAIARAPLVYVPPKRSDVSKPAWKPTPRPPVVAPVPVPVQPPVKVVQIIPPALPGADKLKAKFVEPKVLKPPKVEVVQKQQPATPVPTKTMVNLVDLAKRINKLTHRRKVVLAEACERGNALAAEALGLSKGSVKVYISKILTELTLSYPQGAPFSRLNSKEKKECLFKAWELYHKESFDKNPPGLKDRRPKRGEKRGLFLKERQVLDIFRQMTPEARDKYLKIGKSLLPLETKN